MILLVATGGTISGRHGGDGTYNAAAGAADLLSFTDPVTAASITPIDFSAKLSFEITLDEWLDLAARIHKWNEDPAVAAILVVQGTALLEEAPFLVGLFVDARKPIVFTGAMISGDRPESDAVRNLADAIAVCRDPRSAGYGPLVVMDGRVISADTVHKAHRQSVDAIRSTDAPVGEVTDAIVRWRRVQPQIQTQFKAIALAREVPLIKVVLGMEPDPVAAIVAARPRGIVVEGFPGGGGLPRDIAALIEPLVTQLPVVLGSRAPEGSLAGSSAGGSSGGGSLLRRGFISSGYLKTEKARLLLMAAIANTPPGRDIVAHARAVFANVQNPRRSTELLSADR